MDRARDRGGVATDLGAVALAAPVLRVLHQQRHIASELLEHSDRDDPVFGRNRARVLAAGRPLLVAAQHAHEVRDDLTLEQILDLIGVLAKINGDARYLEPIFQTVLDGLRPP